MNVLGTTWNVDRVASVTDGDTVRLVRSRIIDFDGRLYRLADADTIKGFPVRLVWVDTPERGDKTGWAKARDDLTGWIDERILADIELTVVCYASGGWDRIMGDLRDAEGNSVSQFLMIEKGWLPYTH